MTTKRYLVTGRVQGVGFRNYTQKKARQAGVSGWVRNLDDGRVEAMAAGSINQLESFEVFIRRGPMLAEVRDVKITQENADFTSGDFDILW